MTKKEIITKLRRNHQKFIRHINSLTQEEFEFNEPQKWSAGQELDHIVKSILPVSKMLNKKSFIESKFGISDRKSWSYEKVIEKYHIELQNGAQATGQFIPDEISWDQKNNQIDKLREILNDVSDNLEGYTEDELNNLILPHPLLGKLTIREMLFFIIYHVEHHLNNSVKNVGRMDR